MFTYSVNFSSPKYTKNQKGFAPILLIMLVVIVGAIVLVVFLRSNKSDSSRSASIFNRISESTKNINKGTANKESGVQNTANSDNITTQIDNTNSTNVNNTATYMIVSADEEIISLVNTENNSETITLINDKSAVTIFKGKSKDSNIISANTLVKGGEVKVEKLGNKINIYVQE